MDRAADKSTKWFLQHSLKVMSRKWFASTNEQTRQDRVMRGAIMRMIQRALSIAMDKWRVASIHMIAEAASMVKGLATLRLTSLRDALQYWGEIAVEIRHHTERVAAIKAGSFVYRVDLGVALDRWKFYSQWSQACHTP